MAQEFVPGEFCERHDMTLCKSCEAEYDADASEPIGKCDKCGTPVYSVEGFCGVCEPHKL